jgi:hypothetical protein
MKKWINLTAIIVAFLANIISNIIPINGVSIGEISNTIFKDVLIIPASYAFAIWGLIYLGLISLGFYQLLPSQRKISDRLGYDLTFSSIAQILWLIVFQLRWFTLSSFVMIAILIPLILLYERLKINRSKVTQQQRWLIHYPISLYLGWITIATVVNVALSLYALGWNGGWISPTIWTIFLMVVITVFAFWKRVNIVFKSVIIWALIAISLKHLSILPLSITGFISSILIIGLIFVLKSAKK